MNIKSLKIISLISILLLVLNACAKPNIKTNKKFKHNTSQSSTEDGDD